ncbi:MAG: 50S ribosomal protein L24 [Albidovulum sp.]|nr:50S ribosomal protein L24 [Albidovulum sp.]
MAAKLRKGDKVVVIAGRDLNREGEILVVYPNKGKAVVEGINRQVRHTKPRGGEKGGRIPKDMPVDLSNLALVDPEQGGPTRVGFRIEDGKKVRFAKKSGARIDG